MLKHHSCINNKRKTLLIFKLWSKIRKKKTLLTLDSTLKKSFKNLLLTDLKKIFWREAAKNEWRVFFKTKPTVKIYSVFILRKNIKSLFITCYRDFDYSRDTLDV